MSTRWQSVLVSCTGDDLQRIAEAASILLPLVLRERLSINAFPIAGRSCNYSLECSGFRAGRMGLLSLPSGELGQTLQQLPSALTDITGWGADLALAWIASRIVGTATYILYSDGSGVSAVVGFSEGRITRADWAEDNITETDWQDLFLQAVQAELPEVQYVDDDMFQAVYENNHGDVVSLPVGEQPL